MAIKKRVTTYTMAAATGSTTLGLGASYGIIHKIELKGDDSAVDNNTTFAITDAGGRIILPATAYDAGVDDSTVALTNQDYSTVGIAIALSSTENVAQSPVTIDFGAGTSGDVFQVTLFVEV